MSEYYFVLIILWLAYFAIHSVLASLSFKSHIQRNYPRIMPWYRLIYNTVAILLLFPPLVLMFANRGELLWAWQGAWGHLANLLAVLAILGFIWSLRAYDGREFLGVNQLRQQRRSITENESFRLSVMHRFVRHPWYALSLLLIWTRDMYTSYLVSAVMISLYFVIGSRLEERKLLEYHGERYRKYRQQVPALVPLPWKILSIEESRRLADKEEKR